MTKPVIFTVSAAWDRHASVWTGHCDAIPAAADAATLDELLTKIAVMARDFLPDKHPGIDPGNVYLQLTALREIAQAAASHGRAIRPRTSQSSWPRELHFRPARKGSHEIWHSPITLRNFAEPVGIQSRPTATSPHSAIVGGSDFGLTAAPPQGTRAVGAERNKSR